MDDVLLLIFKLININVDSINDLNNKIYDRNIFISRVNFNKIYEHISKIRNLYPNKIPSNLNDSSLKKQRWPLLNIIRQTLKLYNFIMVPVRVCKKSNNNNKREYIRFFKFIKE